MPYALIHVIQKFEDMDKPRATMWPVKELRSGTSNQPVDQQFINRVFGARLLSGDLETLFDPDAPVGTDWSPVEAALRFHFRMQTPACRLIGVVLNDGKTPGAGTGPFKTLDLDQPCEGLEWLAADINKDAVAPANHTLLIRRSPFEPGLRKGGIWLRGAVPKALLRTGDNDGVEFANNTARQNASDRIQNALTVSGVRNFFNGRSILGTIFRLGQAHFYTKAEYTLNPALEGVVQSVRDILSMGLKEAAARQTTRGRKRKLTENQLAKELQARGVTYNASQLSASFAPLPAQLDTGIKPDWSAAADTPEADLYAAKGELYLGDGGGEPDGP